MPSEPPPEDQRNMDDVKDYVHEMAMRGRGRGRANRLGRASSAPGPESRGSEKPRNTARRSASAAGAGAPGSSTTGKKIYADGGPPGPDTPFNFGMYRGRTFRDITYNEPGYFFWAVAQKPYGVNMKPYVEWVQECFEIDYDARTLQEHSTDQTVQAGPPAEEVSGSKVKRPPRNSKEELRKVLQATKEKCEKCTRFDRTGSNSVVERRMCLDCGTVYTTKREQVPLRASPDECSHQNITYKGSTRLVHKTYCRDCGMLIDSEPQATWKARRDQEPARNRPAPPPAPSRPTSTALTAEDVSSVLKIVAKMSDKALKGSEAGVITEGQLKTLLEDAIDLTVDVPGGGDVPSVATGSSRPARAKQPGAPSAASSAPDSVPEQRQSAQAGTRRKEKKPHVAYMASRQSGRQVSDGEEVEDLLRFRSARARYREEDRRDAARGRKGSEPPHPVYHGAESKAPAPAQSSRPLPKKGSRKGAPRQRERRTPSPPLRFPDEARSARYGRHSTRPREGEPLRGDPANAERPPLERRNLKSAEGTPGSQTPGTNSSNTSSAIRPYVDKKKGRRGREEERQERRGRRDDQDYQDYQDYQDDQDREASQDRSRRGHEPPASRQERGRSSGRDPPARSRSDSRSQSCRATTDARLPEIDPASDRRVFAVPDEACNNTCHSPVWARAAEERGQTLSELYGTERWYRGLGNVGAAGKRDIRVGIELMNGEVVTGTLTSYELSHGDSPLLLGLDAQASLGLRKDVRAGTCFLEDDAVQLYRFKFSG